MDNQEKVTEGPALEESPALAANRSILGVSNYINIE